MQDGVVVIPSSLNSSLAEDHGLSTFQVFNALLCLRFLRCGFRFCHSSLNLCFPSQSHTSAFSPSYSRCCSFSYIQGPLQTTRLNHPVENGITPRSFPSILPSSPCILVFLPFIKLIFKICITDISSYIEIENKINASF